jgi:hypothetical protein
MSGTTLYRPLTTAREQSAPVNLARIVGASAWATLPAALQRRFRPTHGEARYSGMMDLERSAVGACFAWLSIPFGGPLTRRRAKLTSVTVRVSPHGLGMMWERDLGGQIVRSVKLPGPDGQLQERTEGGLGMDLDVTVEDGALVFTSLRFFLSLGRWRIPVPMLLTPGCCRVEHRAIDATRFRFTLTMTHTIWGMTFRQTGIFTDTPAAAG